MEEKELLDLIDEVRGGRQESAGLEWKRQWWDFKAEKAAEEFVKDVCGMANTLDVPPTQSRYIVLGLADDGSTQDAPPPLDEADLQQKLRGVDPHPTVSLRTFNVGGARVTVLSVSPPFDQPYVARFRNENRVFVRMGSSVGTASRRQLDRMYAQKVDTRAPGLHLILSDERGEIIRVPKPAIESAESLRAALRAGLSRLEPVSLVNGRKKAAYQRLVSEVDDFLEAVAEESAFHRWYLATHGKNLAVRVRVGIANTGTLPATGVTATLRFPDAFFVSVGEPYERWYGPELPVLPDIDDLGNVKVDEDIAFMDGDVDEEMPFLALPPVGRPAVALPEPSWIQCDDENTIELSLDRLRHAHEVADDNVYLIALPGLASGQHVCTTRTFSEQALGWTDSLIPLVVY